MGHYGRAGLQAQYERLRRRYPAPQKKQKKKQKQKQKKEVVEMPGSAAAGATIPAPGRQGFGFRPEGSLPDYPGGGGDGGGGGGGDDGGGGGGGDIGGEHGDDLVMTYHDRDPYQFGRPDMVSSTLNKHLGGIFTPGDPRISGGLVAYDFAGRFPKTGESFVKDESKWVPTIPEPPLHPDLPPPHTIPNPNHTWIHSFMPEYIDRPHVNNHFRDVVTGRTTDPLGQGQSFRDYYGRNFARVKNPAYVKPEIPNPRYKEWRAKHRGDDFYDKLKSRHYRLRYRKYEPYMQKYGPNLYDNLHEDDQPRYKSFENDTKKLTAKLRAEGKLPASGASKPWEEQAEELFDYYTKEAGNDEYAQQIAAEEAAAAELEVSERESILLEHFYHRKWVDKYGSIENMRKEAWGQFHQLAYETGFEDKARTKMRQLRKAGKLAPAGGRTWEEQVDELINYLQNQKAAEKEAEKAAKEAAAAAAAEGKKEGGGLVETAKNYVADYMDQEGKRIEGEIRAKEKLFGSKNDGQPMGEKPVPFMMEDAETGKMTSGFGGDGVDGYGNEGNIHDYEFARPLPPKPEEVAAAHLAPPPPSVGDEHADLLAQKANLFSQSPPRITHGDGEAAPNNKLAELTSGRRPDGTSRRLAPTPPKSKEAFDVPKNEKEFAKQLEKNQRNLEKAYTNSGENDWMSRNTELRKKMRQWKEDFRKGKESAKAAHAEQKAFFEEKIRQYSGAAAGDGNYNFHPVDSSEKFLAPSAERPYGGFTSGDVEISFAQPPNSSNTAEFLDHYFGGGEVEGAGLPNEKELAAHYNHYTDPYSGAAGEPPGNVFHNHLEEFAYEFYGGNDEFEVVDEPPDPNGRPPPPPGGPSGDVVGLSDAPPAHAPGAAPSSFIPAGASALYKSFVETVTAKGFGASLSGMAAEMEQALLPGSVTGALFQQIVHTVSNNRTAMSLLHHAHDMFHSTSLGKGVVSALGSTGARPEMMAAWNKLQQAIANGASDEEIKALTNEVNAQMEITVSQAGVEGGMGEASTAIAEMTSMESPETAGMLHRLLRRLLLRAGISIGSGALAGLGVADLAASCVLVGFEVATSVLEIKFEYDIGVAAGNYLANMMDETFTRPIYEQSVHDLDEMYWAAHNSEIASNDPYFRDKYGNAVQNDWGKVPAYPAYDPDAGDPMTGQEEYGKENPDELADDEYEQKPLDLSQTTNMTQEQLHQWYKDQLTAAQKEQNKKPGAGGGSHHDTSHGGHKEEEVKLLQPPRYKVQRGYNLMDNPLGKGREGLDDNFGAKRQFWAPGGGLSSFDAIQVDGGEYLENPHRPLIKDPTGATISGLNDDLINGDLNDLNDLFDKPGTDLPIAPEDPNRPTLSDLNNSSLTGTLTGGVFNDVVNSAGGTTTSNKTGSASTQKTPVKAIAKPGSTTGLNRPKPGGTTNVTSSGSRVERTDGAAVPFSDTAAMSPAFYGGNTPFGTLYPSDLSSFAARPTAVVAGGAGPENASSRSSSMYGDRSF